MALKNLFVRDTRIIISWEERYAKIQLVYNDLVAPIKTIIDHWEHFDLIRPYFTDDNASYAIVNPSQFAEAMRSIEKLKADYGENKKMCFIIDDTVQNMKVLEAAPEGHIIKYKLSASDLIRELPEKTIECDDGWTVWNNNFIWHLPKLSVPDLKGFRRQKITRDELISFLKEELPRYRESGQEIECDINITDDSGCSIEIGRVDRDSIHLTVNWAVPIDSVDTEFDIFGYILSNNTVYSGLNPLEIEQYCPNVTGRNGLSFTKIAAFLDNAYPRWKPWITGNIEQFESIHKWLTPPYYPILKIMNKDEHGIGNTYGLPYIKIGYECLSATILKQALSSGYYHLREGWIRATDLKTAISADIMDNPDASMDIMIPDTHQILHKGDSYLKNKWKDILISNNIPWYAGSNKYNIAYSHLDYLFKWGIEGGLSGGYEAFMSYCLPYLIEFFKTSNLHPIILVDSEYKDFISTIIENTSILRQSDAEVHPYNRLAECKLNSQRICVAIEPPENKTAEIITIMDSCEFSLVFPKKTINQLSATEKETIARLLGIDHMEDLKYIVRSINEPLDEPSATVFPENLKLSETALVFHQKSLNLS